MPRKSLLLVPGPTPVPEAVLRASAAPMVNHRGPEFAAVQAECYAALKQIFGTKGNLIAFPASGTGGLESAIVNTLSPGDRVLSCSVGAFGDRFASIARRFGAEVESCDFEWGAAANPLVVAERLNRAGRGAFKAVLITHNETSTGVVNDVRQIARHCRAHGALVLVDSISGMIAHPLPVDEWDLDVVVAGSQKAFMIPPGLTFVSVSQRAWDAHETARMPRYYWDYTQMVKRDLTPYTPAVSLFYALQEAVRLLLGEGLAEVTARHHHLASALRVGIQAMGLSFLAPESCRSDSVTAIRAPRGVAVKTLRSHMRTRYGAVVAGGQGKLDEEIFRIGHLGYVDWTDIIGALSALEMTLTDLEVPVTPGSGLVAAQQVLRSGIAGQPA